MIRRSILLVAFLAASGTLTVTDEPTVELLPATSYDLQGLADAVWEGDIDHEAINAADIHGRAEDFLVICLGDADSHVESESCWDAASLAAGHDVRMQG